jgi:taurine dehydrogenase small subunit
MAESTETLLAAYDQAWNDHDVDTIVALHGPGMVFHNHTAGERVEGEAVGPHIAQIFQNWPDLAFRGNALRVRDDIAVSEWTASATHSDGRKLEWDGVDIFTLADGKILRKDVYSGGASPRVIG